MVLAVALPLAALGAARGLGLGGRPGADRPTWAAALALAVATAFVPLTAVLVLVLAVAALAVVRGRNLLRLAVLVLVPAVLLLPWLPAVVADPQLLLLEAGLPGPGLSDVAPDAVWALLLRAGGPGMPPLVLTVPAPARGARRAAPAGPARAGPGRLGHGAVSGWPPRWCRDVSR